MKREKGRLKRESNGGEVLRKKKSESGRGRGKGEEGEGEDGWGKGGGCGLVVARDVKRAADKKVAAARFHQKCYC